MPWIGGAISAGGSLIGGLMGGGGANKAAKAQAKATKAAIAEERRQFDLNRADLAPWRSEGSAAVNRLGVLLGLDTPGEFDGTAYLAANPDVAAAGMDPLEHYQRYGRNEGRAAPMTAGVDRSGEAGYGDLLKKFTLADFWDDPVTRASYQQGLDQGTKALANMAGARGNRNSGAQLKALTRFTEDYTGNQAAGSQARFVGDQTNLYNRLAGISGTGQTAAQTGATLGTSQAGTIADLLSSGGNARGAAAIARGNVLSGGIQSAANTLGKYFGASPVTYGGGYTWNPAQFGGGDAWQ